MTLEKDIEKKLVKLVAKYGGRCLKWTCPGWTGVPDRIVLLPGGHIFFVELKRPKGGGIAPMQDWWRNELQGLGFLHFYVHNDDDIRCMEELLGIWAREGFAE